MCQIIPSQSGYRLRYWPPNVQSQLPQNLLEACSADCWACPPQSLWSSGCSGWGNYSGLSRLAQTNLTGKESFFAVVTGKYYWRRENWRDVNIRRIQYPTIADFEDGGRDQEIPVISKSWKRKENEFSSHAAKEEPSLDVSPGRFILDFWPTEV